MADDIYRLHPEDRIDLLALRYGENQLNEAEILCNEIKQDIRRRELWLSNQPLEHPLRDHVLNNLSSLRNNLYYNSIDNQTLLQDLQLRRHNLYHWVNYTSNLRRNFPYCFRCETVHEIDAVHTLMNRVVVWPDGFVFRIGIRRSGLHPPPPVPFDDLLDHAHRLNFKIVTLP